MIPLIENDGLLYVVPHFIGEQEALQWHERLVSELAWSRESVRIYGRSIQSPRLVSWYGDPEAIYRYSGIVHHPRPWPPLLHEIKTRIENCTGRSFNSVLCNLYRDGNDSMGWHADREKELGCDPCLGSLSLGGTRIFRIRHRKTGETHDIESGNGSLIIMAGRLQHYWRHCVPKSRKAVKARINLSFREILAVSAQG
ncbi:MAG: alpha-ketoglutarate-dependent dioxygenase AlkB [Methylococcaceae bacterium]|nr:alpha-ketoglutarate-dependent dioxygenase AlkB [Methylococcaceae bacterium]MCI0668027.1 alpha-ketoglutarate-dependent dioxygenase AlkB [Methylococcaceae bacterium]MCI0732215.1 alpha-ketoglutarate-dependent dioxygenase AlkB [Methylococcaceae bacterium]